MLTKKSRTTSLILTILAGPLGLLYSSPIAGLVLIVIAVALSWTIVVPVACWILAIAWGDHVTYKRNKGIDQMLNAIREAKS